MRISALSRQVVVPVPPEAAFSVFTGQIGQWWPVEKFSVHGTGATAGFRDGHLVETAPDGQEAIWGEVLDWQPPRSFRMTWHPGRPAATGSTVEVSFAPIGDDATLVTVTHDGWESLDDRSEYRQGWPAVLGSLADHVPGTPSTGDFVIVLSHTPAPGVADPFAHPLFPEHARFLEALRERGLLVAAGPFPASGEGMTITRVDSADAARTLVDDAQYLDKSVTGGVLEVRARPWVVMLHGSSLS
jgi:uncharacterized protein YciI